MGFLILMVNSKSFGNTEYDRVVGLLEVRVRSFNLELLLWAACGRNRQIF